MKPLSERERRFVDAYMGQAAGNATKAAELAGYSKKTATTIGSRLFRKVHVRAAIQQRAQHDPLVMDRDDRQRLLTAVATGAKPFEKTPVRDRLKAIELLGKTQGDFVQRIAFESPPVFVLRSDDDVSFIPGT